MKGEKALFTGGQSRRFALSTAHLERTAQEASMQIRPEPRPFDVEYLDNPTQQELRELAVANALNPKP